MDKNNSALFFYVQFDRVYRKNNKKIKDNILLTVLVRKTLQESINNFINPGTTLLPAIKKADTYRLAAANERKVSE